MTVIKPFISLSAAADLKTVHDTICLDLDLKQFSLEYEKLVQVEEMHRMSLSTLVRNLANSEDYQTVTIAIARILAANSL